MGSGTAAGLAANAGATARRASNRVTAGFIGLSGTKRQVEALHGPRGTTILPRDFFRAQWRLLTLPRAAEHQLDERAVFRPAEQVDPVARLAASWRRAAPAARSPAPPASPPSPPGTGSPPAPPRDRQRRMDVEGEDVPGQHLARVDLQPRPRRRRHVRASSPRRRPTPATVPPGTRAPTTTTKNTTSNNRSEPGHPPQHREGGEDDGHRAAQAHPAHEDRLPQREAERQQAEQHRQRPGHERQQQARAPAPAPPPPPGARGRPAAPASGTCRPGRTRPRRRGSARAPPGRGCGRCPARTAAR